MFRRSFFFALIGTIVAAFTAYFFYAIPRDEDRKSYQKLSLESTDLRARSALEKEPIHQQSETVRKEIWSFPKKTPLYACIEGEKSDVTLLQKKEKITAIERLENASCTYRSDVTYLVHGETIEWDTSMKRVKILCPAGRCEKLQRQFSAKEGEIFFNDAFTPVVAQLRENVQISSKEGFALADLAISDLVQKKTTFTSVPPKRVLFEKDNLRFSAPEVLLGETAQAIGDARFSFDLDEERWANLFFPKVRP